MTAARLRLLLCALLALAVWVPSGGRAVAKDLSQTRTFLYLQEPSYGRTLVPLHPETLADMPAAASIPVGSFSMSHQWPQIVQSANGTTLAVSTYARWSNGFTAARNITIRVVDMGTGETRAVFHPQVPLYVQGIADDGSLLFGYRLHRGSQPTATWYALNGTNGRVVATLTLAKGDYWDPVYDDAHHRLFGMTIPQLSDQNKDPRTPDLLAYDMTTGRELLHLPLQGVLAGSGIVGNADNSDVVFTSWQPGFALSPDGKRLAVLDGSSDRLLLIDTTQMRVVQTENVSQQQGALARLGDWLGLLPSPASAKTMAGVSLLMSFSPDGSRLYVTRTNARQPDSVFGSGVTVVDVASGQVADHILSGDYVDWLRSAPDGSAFYALTLDTPTADTWGVLHRVDAQTLQVTAQRAFPRSYVPQLYVVP